MKTSYVDSLFISRSTGDKIVIRTFFGHRRDSYVLLIGGRRIGAFTAKSAVRAYIVRNDCVQVTKF